jgi:very-short-patch-repair endonuclease
LWRYQGLVVELDGHAFHGTRAAFEADRARDRSLHAAGWRVIRVTWHQLQADVQLLAQDLQAVLTRPCL